MTSTVLPPATARAPIVRAMLPVPMMLMLLMRCAPFRVLERSLRLAETAPEAGATDPELLGEQLAPLLDGASARTWVLNAESFPNAAAIAAVLIDDALPVTVRIRKRRGKGRGLEGRKFHRATRPT